VWLPAWTDAKKTSSEGKKKKKEEENSEERNTLNLSWGGSAEILLPERKESIADSVEAENLRGEKRKAL